MKLLTIVISIALRASAANAGADKPSVVAPFRFSPPPRTLTPLDEQKALSYRSQLQDQLRSLERQGAVGRLDSTGRRELNDTRGELQRLNGMLHQ